MGITHGSSRASPKDRSSVPNSGSFSISVGCRNPIEGSPIGHLQRKALRCFSLLREVGNFSDLLMILFPVPFSLRKTKGSPFFCSILDGGGFGGG